MPEREIPLADVRAYLTPYHARAFDRLLTIFPTITCHTADTVEGDGYVFRATYEGESGETVRLLMLNDEVVTALLNLTSELMVRVHEPYTLN